jgi:hypothetical protein
VLLGHGRTYSRCVLLHNRYMGCQANNWPVFSPRETDSEAQGRRRGVLRGGFHVLRGYVHLMNDSTYI